MSLRSKIVVIVSVVVSLYAGLDHLIQRWTITPSFLDLERAEALKDVQRTVEALQTEIEHLDARCRDWATWDDTYAFVAGAQGDFVASNLGPNAFQDDEVNLLFICSAGGRVEWGDIQDIESGRGLALRDFPRERLSPVHPLLVGQDVPRSRSAPDGHVRGLVITEEGPLLVSARPILPSSGEGEIRGTVIMGRLFSRSLIRRLGERTWVELEGWALEGRSLPPDVAAKVNEVTAAPGPVIEVAAEDRLHAYTTFPDIKQAPALLLRASIPRAIFARGASSVRYALISTIAAGMLLLLVLLGVLQRTVLTPIATLTGAAVAIGRTEDASVRIRMERGDEIGVLSREFDAMLAKLQRSHQALVSTARAAGMSEIATGVLHNVGNVLNSVNVSAGLVAERVRGSKLEKLQRLARMVEQHQDDLGAFLTQDPKGRHVAPYLSEVTRLMAVEHEGVAREVQALERGIEHIRALVASQQTYAGRSGLREPTALVQELESALSMSGQALLEHGELLVEREYEELPDVRLDRHKLMEILVNVLKNAREAMEESGASPRRLCLRLRRNPDDGGRVRIEVQDSGPGIPRADLARVFTHGFTTKKNGHGFGLHSSANAAKELGGSLVARSDGPGLGATFVLEIPIEHPGAS
jgi:sensor domain CHASE-containing protein